MISNTLSSSSLVSTVVASRDELEDYAHQWNELLSSSGADTIFLTWEWITTWLDAVYPDAQLFVVVVKDGGGKLIAIAPFYCSDLCLLGVVKYKCLRVIGDCQSGAEYADLIIRSGFEEQATDKIIQELKSNHKMWDCLWMRNIAGWTGAEKQIVENFEGKNFYVHSWRDVFSAIELPQTYEEYLSGLPKKHRHKIKRPENNLRANHVVKMQCCNNESELRSFLDALFTLHGKRWESVGQAGSFARRPPMKQFYEIFALEALRRGWLRIYTLEVDGVLRAVQYGYVYGDSFYALQSAFSPEGPKGTAQVLRSRAIQSCIEEGIKVYDFLGGFADHKRRLGAHKRYGASVLIGKRSVKNRMLFSRKISPTGRFLQEGRPANEGSSHDDETINVSRLFKMSKIFKIIRKFISFLFYSTKHRFVVLPLEKNRKSQAQIPINIMCFDLKHLCSFEALRKIKGKVKDWKSRWEKGDVCYIAFLDGEPVAYLWICHGEWRFRDEDEGAELPEGSVFLYDAMTREKWRCQGVYQALVSKASIELSSRGYDYLYAIVNECEYSSQRALAKLGFRCTEDYIRLYRFFKLFKFRHDKVIFKSCH